MEEGVIRLTAGSALDLMKRLSHDTTPGIEAGPELVYRGFLHDLGINENDLEKATRICAGLLKKT
jgi:hypothetical protein